MSINSLMWCTTSVAPFLAGASAELPTVATRCTLALTSHAARCGSVRAVPRLRVCMALNDRAGWRGAVVLVPTGLGRATGPAFEAAVVTTVRHMYHRVRAGVPDVGALVPGWSVGWESRLNRGAR
jgi:hypothetical protein